MFNAAESLSKYKDMITSKDLIRVNGKVVDVIGLIIASIGPNVALGEVCIIKDMQGDDICTAEVVGFKQGKVLSIAMENVQKISPACEIVSTGKSFSVTVGNELLGRVIDGTGNPIDGKGPLYSNQFRNMHREPPNPLERDRIKVPLQTGIRSIDGLLTIGKGQRIGIFAVSGV